MVAPLVKGPVLESGDRLSRAEFHKRYAARPDLKRAELIGGVVYVPSPTRFTWHDAQAATMIAWAKIYTARHPDVRSGGSATIYLDAASEVQPDAFLFRLDPSGAGPRLTTDGYIEGAPQLIVEVAASSASYDLHDKKETYRRTGVREYLVWRVLDDAIDWFRLIDGAYVLVEPDERGVIESSEFPGLRLNVPALLADDLVTILAELG
jgi:Uma2 family endonuclease